MALLKNKRIFIIEDNVTNLVITQMLLETHGARTAVERWGQDMVERMRRFAPIDLIILDLMFPGGITGYDIFDAIRQHNEFDKIPVVAVSASDPSFAIPKTQEKGFDGFIGKPIDFNLFPHQILKILEGEKVWFSIENT
jgi:CheY-like chemotaxis protein